MMEMGMFKKKKKKLKFSLLQNGMLVGMFASNGMFGVPVTKKLPRDKLAMFHYKMGIFVHANMPFGTKKLGSAVYFTIALTYNFESSVYIFNSILTINFNYKLFIIAIQYQTWVCEHN